LTYEGTLDAVEEKYFNHHDDGRDAIEIDEDKRLEPTLSE
jgi:hypothetical protein